MRQFVKVTAAGRVSLVATNGKLPIVAPGDTLIETTDAPIPRGLDVTVVDGFVSTAPRAPAPEWAIEPE